jgi:hypothetical protein
MTWSKETHLRLLFEAGGETTMYPFYECGLLGILKELTDEGLVSVGPDGNPFLFVRITEKGREVAANIPPVPPCKDD